MRDRNSELWRDIPGYEGSYQASNAGRIRSVERVTIDRLRRARRRPGVTLTPVSSGPYLNVALSGRTFRIHVLIAKTFHGPKPAPGLEVRHLDGNAYNNRADNLAWGTSAQNKADMREHDTVYQRHKTVCPRDHALSSPNLVPSKARIGRRSCLACSRGMGTRRAARRHGIEVDLQREADRHYAIIMKGQGRPDDADCNDVRQRPSEPPGDSSAASPVAR